MRMVPWTVGNHVIVPNLFYFPSPLTVVLSKINLYLSLFSLSLVIILIVDLC